MKNSRWPRGRGFTLVEFLVVLVILGILAAIAAPNMTKMVRTQRIKTAAFDVFSSLVFARSEAIKRNTTVNVTPTSGNWNQGWRITDSNGRVLREQRGWDNVMATGPGLVTYRASGRVSAGANADIQLAADNVDTASFRCVHVDASGRPTTKEGSC